MAKFNTLIKDIYDLIENPEFEISEDNLACFLENLGNSIRETFDGGKRNRTREPKLVASNYGLPPRRLWFTMNTKGAKNFNGAQRINFLYGNIIEEMILMFVKEAGHEVKEEQKRLVVEGVSGKTDARIDDMVVDVKSASSFSFKKFKDGDFILDNDADPFGYKYQLGLYMANSAEEKGAFLIVNKENGQMVSCILDNKDDIPDVYHKIEQDKIIIEQDAPPIDKCYPDIPSGKSGNMILHKLCSFCEFKDICWQDANGGKGLIQHNYASGPVWFTNIARPPNAKDVEE